MKELKKKRYCKKFEYDSDVNNFLVSHPDWEIVYFTGAGNEFYSSVWVIFEYYEVDNK